MAKIVSTGAVPPSSTPIYNKVPALKDSNSIVALSVSISAKISPSFTVSPTFFNQVATVPVVIVSDKRGIVTTFTPAGISDGVLAIFVSVLTSSNGAICFCGAPAVNKAEISSPCLPTIANKESTGADSPS